MRSYESEEDFLDGYHVIDGSVREVWRLDGGDFVVLGRVSIGFGLEQLTGGVCVKSGEAVSEWGD